MKNILNTDRRYAIRAASLILLIAVLTITSTRLRADTGNCGGSSVTLPFTDVPAANIFFCSIAEAFFAGLTNGTSATTFNPSGTVNREQMAAFVTRTLDQSLRRGSKRAALQQFWIPRVPNDMAAHFVGDNPVSIKSDGVDLWVANKDSNNVMRVDGVSGAVTGTWTNTNDVKDLVVARSRIFVIGDQLQQLNPAAPGEATFIALTFGTNWRSITYDGTRLWTSDNTSIHALSLNPVQLATFSTGLTSPFGLVYDGTHIWVTDQGDNSIKKVDINTGAVLQTVTLPNIFGNPGYPCFDGINIWVPSSNDKLYVVRVKDSAGNPLPNSGPGAAFVLATLTGNGLTSPHRAAFDGERVLVTNNGAPPNAGVSLWKATDLTPISSFATDAPAVGVCSDGLNFWFTENSGSPGRIRRF
jgi:S-layer family protein